MSLLAEGDNFIRVAPTQGQESRRSGADLAARLRSKAIDLSYNKATEFSKDIPQLHLMAAKVAFIAFGPAAPELAQYEKDVFYYKNFNPPNPIVEQYEQFKAGRK
jgi:hypothetical protein